MGQSLIGANAKKKISEEDYLYLITRNINKYESDVCTCGNTTFYKFKNEYVCGRCGLFQDGKVKPYNKIHDYGGVDVE